MMQKEDKEARLERARLALLTTLEALRNGSLTPKEADAIEAAIEDELMLCGEPPS